MADYFDEWLKDSEESLAPNLAPHREAIAKIESGGDYTKLGPITRKGDRALGKYQVMARNLPEWSKEALGRAVSPKEFLGSPELQDKIFDHKFGQYLREHGPADAASLWFTGQPLAEGATRKDQLGTSGHSYVKQYLTHLGGGIEGSVSAAPEDGIEKLNKDFDQFVAKAYSGGPIEPEPTPAPAIGAPNWGPLQNLIDAALLGRGTKIAPTAQTQQNIWENIAKGMTGPGEALGAAMAQKPEMVAKQEAARSAWQGENPGTALTTQIIGEALPMFAGVGAGNMALRGAGALVPRLAPAAEFLTGAGARGVPGLAGMTARGASDVATGAWQGALGNAVVGQDPTQGAMWGGALGLPAGVLARAISAPERAVMRPEVAQAAEKYLGLGGELPASPLIASPGTAKVVEGIAGKGDTAAVESFNSLLADRVGAGPIMEAEGVKGLTPEVLARNWDRLDSEFNTFASVRGVNVDKPLVQDIKDVLTDARKDLGKVQPKTVKEVEDVVRQIVGAIKGSPALTGREFLGLTNKGSIIDELFATKSATPYAERLKEALYSALERTLPEAKDEINTLRQQWRDMTRLQRVAPTDPTGLINPKKVANRYGKDTDEFGQIARMGNYLPATTAAGTTKGHSPGLIASLAERVGPGFGRYALGAGAGIAAGTGLPPAFAWALSNPNAAAQIGALAALGFAGKHAIGKRYGSQDYVRKLIENTLRPQVPGAFVNPAQLFIPTLSQRTQ